MDPVKDISQCGHVAHTVVSPFFIMVLIRLPQPAIMPPQKHQNPHGQHGQRVAEDEHHVPDIDGVNRQQDDPRHQGHEVGAAQIPGALGSVCLHHLGDHAAADDQGTGHSQKFKNHLNGHEASLLLKVWEMRLSPPAHYLFYP